MPPTIPPPKTSPPVQVHDLLSPPDTRGVEVTVTRLVDLLQHHHLPQSLPLLRRLQFASRFPGGTTKHARILYCKGINITTTTMTEEEKEKEKKGGGIEYEYQDDYDGEEDTGFCAAYLDLSRGPETELWIYSSLEKEGGAGAVGAVGAAAGDAALAVFKQVKKLRDEYDAAGLAGEEEDEEEEEEEEDRRVFPRTHHSTILVGSLSERLRVEMVNRGCVFPYVEGHDKWLMRTTKATSWVEGGIGRGDPDMLEEGTQDGRRRRQMFRWAELKTREELEFVLARSKISRKVRTLKLLPNKAITLEDGTPIAWCFLGPDSSLTSLHCEEAYRGRGFAKAVAVKVLQDHLGDYGEDGYACADVAPNNPSSQWVCRSLNARVAWTMSWSRIDLDQSFPPLNVS